MIFRKFQGMYSLMQNKLQKMPRYATMTDRTMRGGAWRGRIMPEQGGSFMKDALKRAVDILFHGMPFSYKNNEFK